MFVVTHKTISHSLFFLLTLLPRHSHSFIMFHWKGSQTRGQSYTAADVCLIGNVISQQEHGG